MLSPQQFPAPTGRARDPRTGKEANFKGRSEDGHPIYRVPGSKAEDAWTQLPPT